VGSPVPRHDGDATTPLIVVGHLDLVSPMQQLCFRTLLCNLEGGAAQGRGRDRLQ
jgi:hypothetical protein